MPFLDSSRNEAGIGVAVSRFTVAKKHTQKRRGSSWLPKYEWYYPLDSLLSAVQGSAAHFFAPHPRSLSAPQFRCSNLYPIQCQLIDFKHADKAQITIARFFKKIIPALKPILYDTGVCLRWNFFTLSDSVSELKKQTWKPPAVNHDWTRETERSKIKKQPCLKY